jgi:hypothetical protein
LRIRRKRETSITETPRSKLLTTPPMMVLVTVGPIGCSGGGAGSIE